MIFFLYLTVIALNIYEIVMDKKNKWIKYFSLIVILMLMAGNTYNADYFAYKGSYDIQTYPISWGIGYIVLSKICFLCRFPYQIFAAIFIISSMGVIWYVVRTYSQEYHIVILLYMTFLLFLDTIQIRNCFMVAMWMLAVMFLVQSDRKKFFITIIITSFFHTASVILLLFGFVKPNDIKTQKIIKYEYIIIGLLCLITFINGNQIPFIVPIANMLLGRFMKDKMVYFLTKTNFGFLTSFICQFLNVILAGVSNNFLQNNLKQNDQLRKFSDTVYKVVLVSSFSLPLTMMNSNFSRYIRMNNILIYVMLSIVFQVYKKNKKMGLEKPIATLKNYEITFKKYMLFVGLYLLIWIVLKQDFKGVIDIFSNNII